MAVIGALTAIFRADTRPLTKALRGAEAQAASVGVRLNKATTVTPSVEGIKKAKEQMKAMADSVNEAVERIERLKASGADPSTLKELTTQTARTRREMGKLGADLKEAEGRLEYANRGAARLKQTLSTVAYAAAGAMALALAVATRELKKLGQRAEDFDTLQAETGLTIDQLGELQYLAEQNGWSFEALTKSTGRLAQQLTNIENGSGRAGDAAAQLGIQVRDSAGNLKPMSDLWPQVMAALRGIPDAQQRAALAAQLFGKSFQDLMPLLSATTEQINQQIEGGKQFGAVYTESTHQIGMAADDTFDKMSRAVAGAQVSLTKAFAPLLLVGLRAATRITEMISRWALNISPFSAGLVAALGTLAAITAVVVKVTMAVIAFKKAMTEAGVISMAVTGRWYLAVAGLAAAVGVSAALGHAAAKEMDSLKQTMSAPISGALGADIAAAKADVASAVPEMSVGEAGNVPSVSSVAATGSMELSQILMVVTQIRDLVQRREQMMRAQAYAGSWG